MRQLGTRQTRKVFIGIVFGAVLMACGGPGTEESGAADEYASFEEAINAAIDARAELDFARALNIYDGLLATDGLNEQQNTWARDDRLGALAERATVLAVRDLLGDRELESVTDFTGATTADGGSEVSLSGKFTIAAAGSGQSNVWNLYGTAIDQGNDSVTLDIDLHPEDLTIPGAFERTGIEIVGTEIRNAGVDPGAGDELDEELKQEVLARVSSDIEEYGWHMVAVKSTTPGKAGFVYTVGMWETHQHPEIILFAPQEDPTLIAGRIKELSLHIALGTKFTAGQVKEEVFGHHPGTFRTVHPDQYADHLGVAGAHYGNFSFPALQLFWPDAEGRFPWQEGYDLEPEQPMLDQPAS